MSSASKARARKKRSAKQVRQTLRALEERLAAAEQREAHLKAQCEALRAQRPVISTLDGIEGWQVLQLGCARAVSDEMKAYTPPEALQNVLKRELLQFMVEEILSRGGVRLSTFYERDRRVTKYQAEFFLAVPQGKFATPDFVRRADVVGQSRYQGWSNPSWRNEWGRE